jgi:hypothetical protein
MGTLPGWPVGVGALLGLDLGLRGTLGLGALSLRSLVSLGRIVGLVAWPDLSRVRADLGARIRLFLWIWRGCGRWLRRRVWIRLHRMVADRSLRLFQSVVGWVSRPLWSRKCHQHYERNQHHECQQPSEWNSAAARWQSILKSSQHADQRPCPPGCLRHAGAKLWARRRACKERSGVRVAWRAHDDRQPARRPEPG